MRTGRLSISAALAVAALSSAALAAAPAQPNAGFTRGAHTTRRRTNPVIPLPKHPDPDVARWNDAVDRRKAERKARRGH